MQSRCNGTRVLGGYEIGGSVTASEIFTGTWENRRCGPFELVSVAPCIPPSRGRGVLRVNCQMWRLGLICNWA
jgi:hypothetical protein